MVNGKHFRVNDSVCYCRRKKLSRPSCCDICLGLGVEAWELGCLDDDQAALAWRYKNILKPALYPGIPPRSLPLISQQLSRASHSLHPPDFRHSIPRLKDRRAIYQETPTIYNGSQESNWCRSGKEDRDRAVAPLLQRYVFAASDSHAAPSRPQKVACDVARHYLRVSTDMIKEALLTVSLSARRA